MGKKRILIVEDVDTMGELLKVLVSEIPGYEVSAVVSRIRDAQLQVLRSRPHLVLLDEIMPGESSFDLLTTLVNEQIPTFLITGLENPSHTLPPGALGRLMKPGWRTLAEDRARFKEEIDRVLKVHD